MAKSANTQGAGVTPSGPGSSPTNRSGLADSGATGQTETAGEWARNGDTSSHLSPSAAAPATVRSVGVHEAKTQLSELLRRVEAGEVVEIRRGQRPIARLVPMQSEAPREFGTDRGTMTIPDDFDAPLPQELTESFWP